ncbi:hypothetical protein HBH56_138110 [Parastagonospora nodorum]|uniref:Uncharacterized protein n=1 Tax=Phaeosphaeria nodorum (strain SN15 / ATCC MYA-4574 / FGSC 10173) TaxID=321614 RepID=Q0V530_PHANO|nr:hypothetical protein SNOG_00884 [Parastagonospora nodorum SN15]KAH3910918.1 hypothetical protein HBH56_138110 [Parastagonospora nodorum]EAT92379.1 hypothetical protein SNOG_00884 [Parastagonospora nodorum SN15]KAH3928004.1 hypothetical protein HBH54_143250 [Parastagonospora nodorum]KAH3948979.1 hypothetical protein HBH53_093250 [Parastagonospora nodorum]KAH4005647.1 hypothetical protein HBI10_035800 [Parastagonospora nodorum]
MPRQAKPRLGIKLELAADFDLKENPLTSPLAGTFPNEEPWAQRPRVFDNWHGGRNARGNSVLRSAIVWTGRAVAYGPEYDASTHIRRTHGKVVLPQYICDEVALAM